VIGEALAEAGGGKDECGTNREFNETPLLVKKILVGEVGERKNGMKMADRGGAGATESQI